MSIHRSSERSLYDKLQQPEHARVRELIELLLSSGQTYDAICATVNGSNVLEYRVPSTGERAVLPVLTPQALSRYRARKYAVENRATVMSLIESESESLLSAAGQNPTGMIAQYLRKRLSEAAVAKFDLEVEEMDVADLSRELGRHATIDQRDRKLDLDAEKIKLDEKRIALQEKQAELQRDRFGIAADTFKFLLSWFVNEEPDIADRIAARSDELLIALEESIAATA